MGNRPRRLCNLKVHSIPVRLSNILNVIKAPSPICHCGLVMKCSFICGFIDTYILFSIHLHISLHTLKVVNVETSLSYVICNSNVKQLRCQLHGDGAGGVL